MKLDPIPKNCGDQHDGVKWCLPEYQGSTNFPPTFDFERERTGDGYSRDLSMEVETEFRNGCLQVLFLWKQNCLWNSYFRQAWSQNFERVLGEFYVPWSSWSSQVGFSFSVNVLIWTTSFNRSQFNDGFTSQGIWEPFKGRSNNPILGKVECSPSWDRSTAQSS